MSDRERELEARYVALRSRCSLQRRAVGAEIDAMMSRFGSIDRIASRARSALLQPRVLIAGLFAIVVLRRFRGMSTVGRLLLASAAVRRLWRVAKVFQPQS
jgi:hypothetical protein